MSALTLFTLRPAGTTTATGVRKIRQLCADTGSDTWAYRRDHRYQVGMVGAEIGVQNYRAEPDTWGIIANPVCTEFTPAKHGKSFGGGERSARDLDEGMWLVRECLRVIEEAQPQWWAIENPASGLLRKFLGKPDFTYEPWQFGSPWTKRTALWGNFTAPEPIYDRFEDVEQNPAIYVRPGRRPSLAWLHKSAFYEIPEFAESGMPAPTSDMEMRSLCSQGFAHAFKAANP